MLQASTARDALDEIDGQQDARRLDRLPADHVEEKLHRRLSGLVQWHVNRRQRRDGVRGDGDIVAAHDRAVLRHAQPTIVQRTEHADGHHIVLDKDRGEIGGAVQEARGRLVAALDLPVALLYKAGIVEDTSFGEGLPVAAQAPAHDAALLRSYDGADAPVLQLQQMLRRQQANLHLVRADQSHAVAHDAVNTHDGQAPAQELADALVLLQLGSGQQDAVDAALQQDVDVAFGVIPMFAEAAHDHALLLAPRLAFRAHYELSQNVVAEIARHHTDRRGALAHKAARHGIGHIAQLFSRLQDPRPGLRRDRALAFEHLADGLEADTGPRRHILNRDLSHKCMFPFS